MGVRRFSGKPVPLNLSDRVYEVVTAMVAGRVPVTNFSITWNPSLTYCAARVSSGLSKLGTRLNDPRMELSSKAWPILTEEERDTTLVHEAAHVAAGLLGWTGEHHGPRWRKLMRDYGAKPDRCLAEAASARMLKAFPRKRRRRTVKLTWNTFTLPNTDT